MADVNKYNYQQVHDSKLKQSISVSAVVKVTSFDKTEMTVNVQPLSKSLENGKFESQPPILKVPVAVTRGGGFVFRPWYTAGDVGVVVYQDHDIDNTVAQGGEAEPSTERNHSTSDAVFIGGIVSGGALAGDIPDEGIALSTEDGKTYIIVLKDKVQIKNGGTIAEFTADEINLTAKTVNITGTDAVNITPMPA
jgi:hypothetical protein